MKTESSAFATNFKYALATGGLLATLCGTGCSGFAQKSHVAASPADLRVLAFNEKLDVQTADRWINERWSYLMSFYSQDEDPYFGTSDVDRSCRERSVSGDVKIERSDYKARAVTILTNEDGVAGVCGITQQTHQMRLAFVVCRDRDRQLDLKRICPRSTSCTLEIESLGKYCD